mgnify:CR=1 FL=1
MPPLPQDVEQFLTWMTDQKGFSPATISAYRTDLLQFEEWLHREQHSLARPGELEKYHFQDYSAHLFHEGQARSSIGRKLSALRSLFRYLMKMKKIDKNPAKLVRNPKRELRHPTALNVDQMFTLLDEATDPWGIKVNRVELKNIIPPKEIQNAMEKQMKAERERRESILQAEGQKQSQILVAEGEKESMILRADAAKQAKIMEAEAEKTAKILAAEAESEAIMKVQQATADALKLLNEAAPNDQVVKLKALETMTKVADGKATKIIIPSELQGLAGLAAGAKTVFETEDPKA